MDERIPATGRYARAAALRLVPAYGPELEAQVEAALYARRANQPGNQYLDPVSLASLIVSAATLAWTVYNDLRTKTAKPTQETVTDRVRIELPADDAIAPADREKVIEIVVEEVIKDTDA